jgi:hypothetical protein
LKQDYVDQLIKFSDIDRKDAEAQADRRLGLAQSLVDFTDKIQNAQQGNLQTIVKQIGFSGLSKLYVEDPQGARQAEQTLGLPSGSLALLGSLEPTGGDAFTLSPGQVRYDASGNVVAQAPKATGSDAANRVLSATEAQSLGVPFGTTAGQAYGLTPVKPLTESQGKDLTYAQRASDSNSYIDKLESKIAGMNALDYTKQTLLENTTLGNTFVSDDVQSLRQAERNFATAILRRESGATISPSEFAVAQKQYFPQPGDTTDVLSQKSELRKSVIKSFTQGAGSAASITVKVTSPDGKTGSIPSSQLQEALKNGYKQL